MEPIVSSPTVLAGDPGPRLMAPRPARAERLLMGMYKVFSHDLPNQLVVIQSLVSLLELEEKDRLSAEAQEYLTRLTGATRRAGAMVQFLKQMARLNSSQEAAEKIGLVNLGRELQTELKTLFPEHSLVHEMHWDVPMVRFGRRSLHDAVLEVIRCGIQCCKTNELRVHLGSRARAEATLVDVAVGVTEPYSGRHEALSVDTRLDLRLARELLAGWGGALELITPAEGTYAFTLVIPSAPEAGGQTGNHHD